MKISRRARLWWLAGLLVSAEVLYLAMLRLDAVNGLRPVLMFLGLLGLLFALYAMASVVVKNEQGNNRGTLLIIAAGAVLFRLTLLPAGLPHDASWGSKVADLRADLRGESVTYERFQLFDSDIWRYLWDGHVWAHGTNPYLHAPTDPALDKLADEENAALTDGRVLWSDIRDNINYALTPTIYPPLAQVVFRVSHILAPGSVLVMKGLLVGFDLLATLFIALTLKALGRPVAGVLLYAWNPLIIKVFAASGHVDAVVAATLAATTYFLVRHARAMAALSFGLAILAKLTPLVLLPFIVRRIGWRNSALVSAVLVAGYVPFFGAGRALFDGALTFARDWQFNAGPFALFQWLSSSFSTDPNSAARVISGLGVIAIVCWLVRRDDGRSETFAHYAAPALGALLVLGPTVMPWYVAWLLPLAIIADRPVWVYFSALVCLAFLVMVDETEHAWTLWLEYSGVAALLLLEFQRTKRHRAAHNSTFVRNSVVPSLNSSGALCAHVLDN
ncbi:MAG: glycosyltransferase 87 family protein [Candidatus Acidoferrales bacterium]